MGMSSLTTTSEMLKKTTTNKQSQLPLITKLLVVIWRQKGKHFILFIAYCLFFLVLFVILYINKKILITTSVSFFSSEHIAFSLQLKIKRSISIFYPTKRDFTSISILRHYFISFLSEFHVKRQHLQFVILSLQNV